MTDSAFAASVSQLQEVHAHDVARTCIGGHRTPGTGPRAAGPGGHAQLPGISAIAYHQLKQHLGITAGATHIYDVVQQLAQPEDPVLDRFGVDVLDIGRVFNERPQDWYDITLVNRQPAKYPTWFHPRRDADGGWTAFDSEGLEIARMPSTRHYLTSPSSRISMDTCGLGNLPRDMNRILWSALVHSPWDHAAASNFWVELRRRALAVRQSSDRALMIVVGCNLFEWGTFLRRMDNFMMDVIAEPEQVARLLDALMERHLAGLEKVCAAVGDIADVCRFGDGHLGRDSGPFMSPDSYAELFKPRHTMLCDYVHKHSQMKTFLHSCGSIRELLPHPDRGGVRRDQSGPDRLPRHGAGGAEARLRPGHLFLGRRLRHAAGARSRDPGRGAGPCAPPHRHPRPGWRIRV